MYFSSYLFNEVKSVSKHNDDVKRLRNMMKILIRTQWPQTECYIVRLIE